MGPLIGWLLVGFITTFMATFISGLGLMGGGKRAQSDAYYMKRTILRTTAICAFLGLCISGWAGLLGGPLGAWLSYALVFRKMLK